MEKKQVFEELRNLTSIDEAIEVLGVSRMTYYRLRKRKNVKTVKIGRRVYLHPKDLRALMEEAVA